MKVLYLSIVFLLYSCILNGQQKKVDSLSDILKKVKNNSEKFYISKQIIGYYIENKNFKKEDSIYKFLKGLKNLSNEQILWIKIGEANSLKLQSNFEQAADRYVDVAEFSKKIKDSANVINGYLNSGLCHKYNANYLEAKNKILKAERLAKAYQKYQLYNEVSIELATLYSIMGQYEKSVKLLIEISDRSDLNIENKNEILSTIGFNYLELSAYDKALKYFKKSLQGFKSINDTLNYVITKRSISLSFSRKKVKLEQALQLQKEVLDYFLRKQHTLYTIDSYVNIGATYSRLGNHIKSIKNNELALQLSKQINSEIGIKNTKYNIADSYIELGNYKEAQKNLNELISGKYKLNPSLELKIYENLGLTHYKLNQFKSAYLSIKKSKILSDSIYKSYVDSKIPELETKYQAEKKEKQLVKQKVATQQQEILTEKANNRNWLLGFGILASLISVFFIWRRYKSEAKAKQIISEQKIQIEKLQREFHHRIKNDFRSINSFIRLAQKKFPETEFQERLNELKNRVTSMFKVHELLLDQNDITQIKAKPYLTELSDNITQKYGRNDITLDYNIDDAETIVSDKSIPLGVILNEFVTNSYKHAFNDKGGNISVNFYSDKNNYYLILKDNGKGLPHNFDTTNIRSFGLEIMPLLAEQYDGEFKLKSNNGVSVTVTLPKQIV